ncbi:MAG TPA: sulfate adenylyltransferase [Thermoanaerobaculia bacterium]|nr:sulfate adenylyltransferase [Thermoanaerobaculia bacterium]
MSHSSSAPSGAGSTDHLIPPHGGVLIDLLASQERSAELRAASRDWPSWDLTPRQVCDLELLANGSFSPLTGFLNRADTESVGERLRLANGTVWPLPVNLDVSEELAGKLTPGGWLALRDPEGVMLAALEVEEIWQPDREKLAAQAFGTVDRLHPGAAHLLDRSQPIFVGGRVEALQLPTHYDYKQLRLSPAEVRAAFARRGWRRVVAFQTRNPMHRAHEELCRMAKERLHADGIVIHMLLGKLKEGDIPASVRDACIRVMVEKYFEPDSVLITGYGFDMLYAGPREAVLHAIFRQNMGATHLIVGRDHAGVGSYYGPFDAQAIFDTKVPKGALEIQIFGADNTAWSKKLGRVVMKREAPGHTDEDYIDLSGTKVREMLGKGIAPPPEFSRPEVAKVLMDYYRSIGG